MSSPLFLRNTGSQRLLRLELFPEGFWDISRLSGVQDDLGLLTTPLLPSQHGPVLFL